MRDEVRFPAGYCVAWSGQFEYLQRALDKLKVVVPLTLLTLAVIPALYALVQGWHLPRR